jgi:hypothetical protein
MTTMRDLELKAMRKGGMRATLTRNMRARSAKLARQGSRIDQAAEAMDSDALWGHQFTGKARGLRKRADRKFAGAANWRRMAQRFER